MRPINDIKEMDCYSILHSNMNFFTVGDDRGEGLPYGRPSGCARAPPEERGRCTCAGKVPMGELARRIRAGEVSLGEQAKVRRAGERPRGQISPGMC